MLAPISVEEKQHFIVWFLQHFKLKKRESKWILEYLVNYKSLLKNVHFVRDIKHCPRALIITSRCSDGMPLLFYKESVVTKDSEKLFHDIRLNQDDPLYIQLNFYNSIQSSLYVAILEDNPYLPENQKKLEEDRIAASQILNRTLFLSKTILLKSRIDSALDEKDKETFIKLSKELEVLELNQTE